MTYDSASITTPALRRRLGIPEKPETPPKYAGNKHFWTQKEKKILVETYPTKGPAECVALLPRHHRNAIYQMAASLGLRAPKGGGPKTSRKHLRNPDVDARIKAAWPGLTGKGDVVKFALRLSEELGVEVPRFFVSTRALALGLTMPHKKEPPWTPEEMALLREIPLHDLKMAARRFREHGYARTPASIGVKAKRVQVSRRYRQTLSKRQVARILGVDDKWPDDRIREGLLKATRRGTARSSRQGGDAWSVTREDCRQFIIDHLEMIDIRKVDKFAFVELLTRSSKSQ